jgi:MFS transporter, ACS family, D-galactonate transporter
MGLIFVAVLINYVDRGILSVVAVALMEELKITPAQMGGLLSAFFWTYTPMQVPVASALVGWAGSFAENFALMLLLGIGEATAPLV